MYIYDLHIDKRKALSLFSDSRNDDKSTHANTCTIYVPSLRLPYYIRAVIRNICRMNMSDPGRSKGQFLFAICVDYLSYCAHTQYIIYTYFTSAMEIYKLACVNLVNALCSIHTVVHTSQTQLLCSHYYRQPLVAASPRVLPHGPQYRLGAIHY